MPAAATSAMTVAYIVSVGTGIAQSAALGTACAPRSLNGPSALLRLREIPHGVSLRAGIYFAAFPGARLAIKQ